MLDRQRHEYYIKRIFRDIVAEPRLGSSLALKGGTCLYLFYSLPRFSVDLDFNLISSHLATDAMESILKRYVDVEHGRFRQREDRWLWEASYEAGLRHFQIDISRSTDQDTYELKQFYGLSVQTMTPECMLAHKLCAVIDRSRLQNRDLFDSWFMLERMDRGRPVFGINEQIIQRRTGKTVVEYLTDIERFVTTKVNRATVLAGLGELLTEKQKAWVKEKLVDELVFQLRLRREMLG